jgi:hypothetical protein
MNVKNQQSAHTWDINELKVQMFELKHANSDL